MVSVLRRPVYLSGRYLKIARGLSQTKWLIGGVQKGLGSVEELIGPVAAKHFKASVVRSWDGCTSCGAWWLCCP